MNPVVSHDLVKDFTSKIDAHSLTVKSMTRIQRAEYFAEYRSTVGSLQQQNDRYRGHELKQRKIHHASYRSAQQVDQSHGNRLKTSTTAGTFASGNFLNQFRSLPREESASTPPIQ